LVACALLGAGLAALAGAQAIQRPDLERIRGNVVPDVELIGEDGTAFRLSSLSGKPILVSPIFTRCPATCSEITGSLRDALATIGEPAVGYQVLTLSFDPADGPAELRAYREQLALPAGWKLAAATPENLAALLDALDFQYAPLAEGGFAHANAVAVLSPALAVSGTLNGVVFEEAEVRAALERAADDASLIRHYRPWILLVGVLALATTALVLVVTKKKPASA
jgi:protein SCO1/2